MNNPQQQTGITALLIKLHYLELLASSSRMTLLHKVPNERLKHQISIKKSRIRETLNLSTDADRRTDTILKRLRDLSFKQIKKKN